VIVENRLHVLCLIITKLFVLCIKCDHNKIQGKLITVYILSAWKKTFFCQDSLIFLISFNSIVLGFLELFKEK